MLFGNVSLLFFEHNHLVYNLELLVNREIVALPPSLPKSWSNLEPSGLGNWQRALDLFVAPSRPDFSAQLSGFVEGFINIILILIARFDETLGMHSCTLRAFFSKLHQHLPLLRDLSSYTLGLPVLYPEVIKAQILYSRTICFYLLQEILREEQRGPTLPTL